MAGVIAFLGPLPAARRGPVSERQRRRRWGFRAGGLAGSPGAAADVGDGLGVCVEAEAGAGVARGMMACSETHHGLRSPDGQLEIPHFSRVLGL